MPISGKSAPNVICAVELCIQWNPHSDCAFTPELRNIFSIEPTARTSQALTEAWKACASLNTASKKRRRYYSQPTKALIIHTNSYISPSLPVFCSAHPYLPSHSHECLCITPLPPTQPRVNPWITIACSRHVKSVSNIYIDLFPPPTPPFDMASHKGKNAWTLSHKEIS
jgi:hypothetical protein